MARTTTVKKSDATASARSRSNVARPATFRAKFLERALLEFSVNAAASLGSAAAKKRATLSQMREASKRLQSAAAKAKVTSKKRIISDREATDEANAELQAFKAELKGKEGSLAKAANTAGEAIRRASADLLREARSAALKLVDSKFPASQQRS